MSSAHLVVPGSPSGDGDSGSERDKTPSRSLDRKSSRGQILRYVQEYFILT